MLQRYFLYTTKTFKVTRIWISTKIMSDRRIGPKNITDRRNCIPLYSPLIYGKSKASIWGNLSTVTAPKIC